jgi:hypothetical protein
MIRFWVPGTPAPKGSMKSVLRAGRIVTFNNSTKTGRWQKTISTAARYAMRGRAPWCGDQFCLYTRMVFGFESPASRYGSGRNARQLKPDARRAVSVKPDIDKLARTVLDGLTRVAFDDDARIVGLHAEKIYLPLGQPGGVVIEIGEWYGQHQLPTTFYLETVWSEQPGFRIEAAEPQLQREIEL